METAKPMGNPDLLPASSDQMQQSVPRLNALTLPMSNTKLPDMYHFLCTIPGASIHRADGKKLPFVNGYLATDIQEDAQFLMNEVRNGNPYLRAATEQEIANMELRLNPVAAIEKSMRLQLEPQIRAELEAKIRAEIAASLNAGEDPVDPDKRPEAASTAAAPPDPAKIAGVDRPADIRARINAASGVVQGTIKPAPLPVIDGGNRPLISPVSSADIASAAATSGK